MAKSLRDIIVPRAGRNVPKGEADFLDLHKVDEKDYPVKQKKIGQPHRTNDVKHHVDDRHGHTKPGQSELKYKEANEDVEEPASSSDSMYEEQCNKSPKGKNCPIHGLNECSSIKEGFSTTGTSLKQRATRVKTVHIPHPQKKDGNTNMTRVEDIDHEGEMARAQLKHIANKAINLHLHLKDDQQLKAWVQAKITNAKQLLDDVCDHIHHENDKEVERHQENETTGPDSAMQFPHMNTDNNYGAI